MATSIPNFGALVVTEAGFHGLEFGAEFALDFWFERDGADGHFAQVFAEGGEGLLHFVVFGHRLGTTFVFCAGRGLVGSLAISQPKVVGAFEGPNGILFVICYAPSESKSRPFEVASEIAKAGFNHVDNIVVEKTWQPGLKSKSTLVNTHDYVFFFVNGDTWTIDRTPIKQYLFQQPDQPCCSNTWLVESGSLDESYSDDLAELLIRFADLLPGSSIFDPYMGNAGIVKSCLKLGHSLTGFEPDLKKITQYQKIIEEFKLEDVE